MIDKREHDEFQYSFEPTLTISSSTSFVNVNLDPLMKRSLHLRTVDNEADVEPSI